MSAFVFRRSLNCFRLLLLSNAFERWRCTNTPAHLYIGDSFLDGRPDGRWVHPPVHRSHSSRRPKWVAHRPRLSRRRTRSSHLPPGENAVAWSRKRTQTRTKRCTHNRVRYLCRGITCAYIATTLSRTGGNASKMSHNTGSVLRTLGARGRKLYLAVVIQCP